MNDMFRKIPVDQAVDSGGAAYGLKDPVRSDVQREAFVRLIMRNTGMDYDEAQSYVDSVGMEEILRQFKGPQEISKVEGALDVARDHQEELRRALAEE